MFAAVSVSSGRLRTTYKRVDFPELNGRAAGLYENAYGPELVHRYPRLVNDSETYRDDPDFSEYKHAPYHDVESFFWVLFYTLIRAWPEGDVGTMNVTAQRILKLTQGHRFVENEHDDREGWLRKNHQVESIEKALSPKLQKFAPFLIDIRDYVGIEWAGWAADKFPADHCHEAVKRILLNAIVELQADPIPFEKGMRISNI